MYSKLVPVFFAFAGMSYANTNTGSSPLIYLDDNFGETRGLCLDIVGFGDTLDCAEPLHIHTCKRDPQDTQFWFDGHNHRIKSVNFNSNCEEPVDDLDMACATVERGCSGSGCKVKLTNCRPNRQRQDFILGLGGLIHLEQNPNLCLGTVEGVNNATSGSGTQAFVKRELEMTRCDGDASLVTFHVIDSNGVECEVGKTCWLDSDCCDELVCDGSTCQNHMLT